MAANTESRDVFPPSTADAIEANKNSYDAEVKNILQERVILARILKRCVSEFADYDLRDIAEKCIEGDPIVASVPVDQDAVLSSAPKPGEKIAGRSGEDVSISEGKVTYDVLFTACTAEGERIKLIINVEAQRELPGYPLLKRAVYYAARMISAQKNREFHNSEYQNICKVYSIWICQEVPAPQRYSIVQYHLTENILLGQEYGERLRRPESEYDLLSVVMIGLGKAEERNKDDLVRLLTVILSPDLKADQKFDILESELGIVMTPSMEKAVDDMCNLSTAIEERGIRKGLEQGIALGKEQGIALGKEEGIALGKEQGVKEGGLIMLFKQVSAEIITPEVAAELSGMDEYTFLAEMDAYFSKEDT